MAAWQAGDDVEDPTAPEYREDIRLPDEPVRSKYDDTVVSDLDRLRKDTVEKIKQPFELVVPGLDGYTVVIRPDVQYEELEGWRRRSREKNKADLNPRKLNGLVLAGSCIGIKFNGKLMVDSEQEEVTFGSDELMQVYGVSTAGDAAVAFVQNDGPLFSLGGAIVARLGFGGDVEDALTPTEAR